MALTLSNSIVVSSPIFTLNQYRRFNSHVLVRSVHSDSVKASQESVSIGGASSVTRKTSDLSSYDDGGEKSGQKVPQELGNLWDDGYGTQTIKDCYEIGKDLIKSAGGPPRWFCPVACGKPIKDSPLLLYLPGVDGLGSGLSVHTKALGKVFHVQCLHIPVSDRSTLEGLMQIVEETVLTEHTLHPNKPIYLLGDSFGGALALAVAARIPAVDLTLILANPGTAYEKSMLHPLLLPLVGALPEEYHWMFPYIVGPLVGDYVKSAMVRNNDGNYLHSLWRLRDNIKNEVPHLSVIAEILPKDTFQWRLKLTKAAAAYANSRLHVITAQVLVLASGKDQLMPSKDEAHRLSRSLRNCTVRVFKENGHTILLESGVDVLAVIKATRMYRRFSKHDILKDFLPSSIQEVNHSAVDTWWYRLSMGAAMFSTMEDGKIVRGLAGIPDEGPVLIVGNHMLLSFEAFPIVMEFLREKKIVLHALTHPELFNINAEHEHVMIPLTDIMKLGGSVPVSARNLFRLLHRKSHMLLYPGGIREALHLKGETGKLFWPDKQEFVRMAVKCGATIIPYGGVGEDDLFELIFDYNDIKRNPLPNLLWSVYNQGRKNLRKGMKGEIGKQQFHMPVLLPKMPGRVYYLFGKPIRTKGKEYMSNDEDYLQELYMKIRSDVENNMDYLLKKREEDPYRNVVDRLVWKLSYGTYDVPSFEP